MTSHGDDLRRAHEHANWETTEDYIPARTIREQLRTILARHWLNASVAAGLRPYCGHCKRNWPCPDRMDVLGALRSLDEAELISEYRDGNATERSHWRYIADPNPLQSPCPCPMCPDPTHGGTKGAP